jgi:hypothetical protein
MSVDRFFKSENITVNSISKKQTSLSMKLNKDANIHTAISTKLCFLISVHTKNCKKDFAYANQQANETA